MVSKSKKMFPRQLNQNRLVSSSIFKEAVENTVEISGGYRTGLKALEKKDRAFVKADSNNLTGSVNIDKCVESFYPEDARWDYVIGYKDKAYFVEVHPANTSNVSEMLKKAVWLLDWLKVKAQNLEAIKADNHLYWIPSGECKILINSPQSKRLAKSKILIRKPLDFCKI